MSYTMGGRVVVAAEVVHPASARCTVLVRRQNRSDEGRETRAGVTAEHTADLRASGKGVRVRTPYEGCCGEETREAKE